MSLVNEDRVLMGHAGSIITLWDTSREMLTQDQKITMKQSIYDAFNPTEEMQKSLKGQGLMFSQSNSMPYVKQAVMMLVPEDPENEDAQKRWIYDEDKKSKLNIL